MISVIIPTYNEERYLEKTLLSLKRQGDKHEVIVVDGRSTDKTVAVAKPHADKVIVVSGGVSKARNRGAAAASGDILFFLDADTRLEPGTLKTFQMAFEDRRIVGACANIRSEGFLTARILYKITSWTAMLTSLLGAPLFYGMCMAWRRDAFMSMGGFDERISIGEDINLSLSMRRKGKCVWLKSACAITSPRRLRGRWLFLTPYIHMKNFFKMILLGKTDKYYPPIR